MLSEKIPIQRKSLSINDYLGYLFFKENLLHQKTLQLYLVCKSNKKIFGGKNYDKRS